MGAGVVNRKKDSPNGFMGGVSQNVNLKTLGDAPFFIKDRQISREYIGKIHHQAQF